MGEIRGEVRLKQTHQFSDAELISHVKQATAL
jgi:hypothetical protein